MGLILEVSRSIFYEEQSGSFLQLSHDCDPVHVLVDASDTWTTGNFNVHETTNSTPVRAPRVLDSPVGRNVSGCL